MAKCPFAVWRPISGPSGSYLGGPFKIVHHTTEGGSASGAMQAYAAKRCDPHFTVDADTIYQHIDTSVAARALRNPPGGVETNRDSAVQIEVVGFAHLPKNPVTLANVARLCRWIEATHGVPRSWPAGPPKPAENGHDPGGHLRDPHIWDTQGGHYGHCHVPENTHWDPGYTRQEADFLLSARFDDSGRLTKAVAPLPAMAVRTAAAVTTMPDHAGELREGSRRVYNARPDALDFRDRMYEPTLVEVPSEMPLASYLASEVPVLDQGTEGACTGFALATVANCLLRLRAVKPDRNPVSPRMLYELARRYDEWPGEDYSGSSARGAMKGWHKHGVCALTDWPNEVEPGGRDPGFSADRMTAAKLRPLGAYYRVDHRDLVAMHAAIAETRVLYATATVHRGWENVGPDGMIAPSDDILGGHAFAIVGYDQDGFWFQNSWGPQWGQGGCGHMTYDDWLHNATDVWVARLGAPVKLAQTDTVGYAPAKVKPAGYAYADLRPHIVSVGNNGRLRTGGDFGTGAREVATIFEEDLPKWLANGQRRDLLLYAHGGLVEEASAVQRIAEYSQQMTQAGIYPLAFIWHTDYQSTLANVLEDAVRRRRPEGFLDKAKDFILDRMDDMLEPLARQLTGKTAWDEVKQNALLASAPGGAAYLVADHIVGLKQQFPDLRIHLMGHSAGAILLAPLLQHLTADGPVPDGPLHGQTGAGLEVDSCTLWAPACTLALFREAYLPALDADTLRTFALYVLDDPTERADNCAHIYNRSVLYLVSNAFEEHARVPGARDGEPLLGMKKAIDADPQLQGLLQNQRIALVVAPEAGGLSAARSHGGFDEDGLTLASSLQRILGRSARGAGAGATAPVRFARSASELRSKRQRIDLLTRPRI